MKRIVTSICLYPIKGMKGIQLSEAQLSTTGLQHDRQWMIIGPNNRAVTQREMPLLSLFNTSLHEESIKIEYDGQELYIPKESIGSTHVTCHLFDKKIEGILESDTINQWLSRQLNTQVRLVQKSTQVPRYVNGHPNIKVNFADGHQYLILGRASMDHLNTKLDNPIDINRFRANIIFEGGEPHEEDTWTDIEIAGHHFEKTKPCSRCKVTTIDQENATVGKEPIKTLATYRLQDRKINFGTYYKCSQLDLSTISVGDEIIVKAS